MSLSPQRAKAEATNRCALFVQLTLAWTPTLLSFVIDVIQRRHRSGGLGGWSETGAVALEPFETVNLCTINPAHRHV